MANAVTLGLTSLRVRSPRLDSGLAFSPPRPSVTAAASSSSGYFPKLNLHSGHRRSGNSTTVVKSTSEERNSLVPADDAEDGVLLGTMKLPSDTDVQRFQILLFQVDKIAGGTRLGFIEIGDGATEVPVYIDCLVFPGNADSVPIFRAVRNGRLKDKTPPGEPRIMRSLMQALQKSVQIARV